MNSRIWKIFIVAAAVGAAAHCNTTDRTRRGYLRAAAPTFETPPPRPAIVIAGFGVTRLLDPVTNRYVWGTPRSMVHTRYADDLDFDPNDRLVPRGWVGSRGPVNTGWQLSIALRKFGGYRENVDVIPFFYDWRRSARDNARLLGDLVERTRNGGNVDLVAHSAGALVATTYLKTSAQPPVENLVLIAPVQRGVVDAFRIFVRPERLMRRTFTPQFVATWPFVFELLPHDGRIFVDEEGKALDVDVWDTAIWKADVAPMLTSARALHDELRGAPIPPRVNVSVIAGDCVPTARRVLLRRDGSFAFYPHDLRDSERHLASILFEPGDGTVPISSARGNDAAMIVCDGHQGIAADPTVHRALVRALRGK